MNLFKTNVFRSIDEELYYNFPCYSTDLTIDTEEFWKVHRSLDLVHPYTVHGGHLYFMDDQMLQSESFVEVAAGYESTFLSVAEEDDSKVVYDLTLDAIRGVLEKVGFSSMMSKGKRFYYLESDGKYVLKISKDGVTYRVFRGFAPHITIRTDIGALDIRFSPLRAFRIEFPADQWNQWIGFEVKVRRNSQTEVETAILYNLIDVDQKNQEASVQGGGNLHTVDIGLLYVPASPRNLKAKSVYVTMNRFSRFKDYTVSASYDLLSSYLERFALKGWFTLNNSLLEDKEVRFRNLSAAEV